MKKLAFLFFAFLLIFNDLHGQCPEGNLTFTTQQAVDSFPILYPNCTQLSGSLAVGTFDETTDITDLSPLNQITSIIGGLDVQNNDNLENLYGLNNNIQIYSSNSYTLSSLSIRNNPVLINLFETGSIYVNNGGINISNNQSLIDLSGAGLSADFYIYIQNNPSLVSLFDVHPNYVTLEDISIHNNDALTNLSLKNIQIIYELRISDNDVLTNLNGLSNIDAFGGLIIQNNNALENLTGTSEVRCNDILEITENASLTSLEGIDSIVYQGAHLQIDENPLLNHCHEKSVCDYIENMGNPTINNNLTDCNSVEEVVEKCIVPTERVINDARFSMFPNPVESELYIELDNLNSEKEISITNITGDIIHHELVSFSGGTTLVTFDVANYPAGVYFLSISDDKETQVQRFIKS